MSNPKIVIVDGHTLNPGDLSWDPLRNTGNLIIYDESTSSEEIIERCQDANYIIANKAMISRQVIEALPDLMYIGVSATGFNNVDLEAATEKGITVTNVPAYGTASVAQHTFTLIFELAAFLSDLINDVRAGGWKRSGQFAYTTSPTIELADKTLGIIGYGRIAKKVIQIGQALDMRILVHTNMDVTESNIDFVDIQTLFKEADVVSLHTSLRKENAKIVNKNTLGLMKQTAMLINTSRGGLIDELDLYKVLKNKKIRGAALDVLMKEPPEDNHPLIGLNNCIITPHMSWMTIDARSRLLSTTITNLQSFHNGEIVNKIN